MNHIRANTVNSNLLILLATISCLTILFSSPLNADVHPEVQAALEWQFPENNCTVKRIKRSGDVTTANRLRKKAGKKYKKCLSAYKAQLQEEQEKLMAVAHHGLTESQAEVIIGHINEIRWVVEQSSTAIKNAGKGRTENRSTMEEKDFYDPMSGH